MIKASQLAEGANQLYTGMDEDSRMHLDIHSAMLFCALNNVGLLPHWPSVVQNLSAEQMGVLRHLVLQMTPVMSPPAKQQEEETCPHAAPHTYCQSCAVSPCPLGLEPND